MTESELPFDFNDYINKIDKIIHDIISRPEKNDYTYDILDTEKTIINKKNSLIEKHRLMKIGEIWQEVIGNYDGFINLKTGHETGLDIISYKRKIAIELKNRTNTDNHSSKKTNLSKLAKFKKDNLDFICIYANINASSEKETMTGKVKIIIIDGVEIQQQIGMKFLKFIFNEHVDTIIKSIKRMIDENVS